MDEIQSAIDQNAKENQFGVSPIPAHAHTGTDSLRINVRDLIDAPIFGTGRSHKTSAQTISTGTATKVVWEVNDYASNVTWDSTNNRFTILNVGKYLIKSTVYWVSPAANIPYLIFIYKNASESSRVVVISATGGNITDTILDVLSLAAGDYIEIYVYQGSVGDTDISSNALFSNFSVTKVG